MEKKGLDCYEIKEFKELLIKANKLQLRSMHKSLVSELQNRDKYGKES
jgi:hypothetical protein